MTRPGTGNRLGTGAGGGPVVTARPLTQQGLAGAKTSTQFGRQIQDGQYFYTKLSEKMAHVAEANERLRQELATIEKSRSRQEQLQARLEELKDEVTTADVHLRDYNLILQKSAMQATSADVEDTLRTVNVSFVHLPAAGTTGGTASWWHIRISCSHCSLQEEASQLNSRLQSVTNSRLNAETRTETLESEVCELEQQVEVYLGSMSAEERAAYMSAQAEVITAHLTVPMHTEGHE